MSAPYRATVTIDGTAFEAVSASVAFTTSKDSAQMPEMGSLKTQVSVWVDMHDTTNMPFGQLSKLFDLAKVVTKDKVKPIKIEFWQDDSHEDALCAYSFNGWISRFETSNPLPAAQNGNGRPALNNQLYMELEPVMNQTEFSEISMSN